MASFFFVIQRSFGSSFRRSRAGTSQRINDSAEGLGPSFQLKSVPSNPSVGCQKRRDNYSEEAKHPILNNYEGANLGNSSVDTLTIMPVGIVRTRKVDVV